MKPCWKECKNVFQEGEKPVKESVPFLEEQRASPLNKDLVLRGECVPFHCRGNLGGPEITVNDILLAEPYLPGQKGRRLRRNCLSDEESTVRSVQQRDCLGTKCLLFWTHGRPAGSWFQLRKVPRYEAWGGNCRSPCVSKHWRSSLCCEDAVTCPEFTKVNKPSCLTPRWPVDCCF